MEKLNKQEAIYVAIKTMQDSELEFIKNMPNNKVIKNRILSFEKDFENNQMKIIIKYELQGIEEAIMDKLTEGE